MIQISRPRISRPRPFRRRPSRRGHSRGQAVVEFALILPVFLLLTVGVVDMARVFTSYIALTNGVSEAAIYAAQGTNYLSWCASGGSVPCPTAAPTSGTLAQRQVADPANIAYQINIEATGLTKSGIIMSKPQCTPTVGGAAVDCTSSTTGIYSNVKIVATYQMTMLTPLISNIMGGPITMTAATTAAILQ